MFHADRLIAAFDGSDDSKKALQKAIDLSKTLHATLTVVHSHNAKDTQKIVDSPMPGTGATYIGGGIASVPDPLNTEGTVRDPMIYEDRTEEVIAEARMLMNDNQIDGDIDILEGDPADAIIEHADRIAADLIVMGSRDQNKLKKLLFGSVSEKLSSKSDIPVLIVK
ncbi:universal stress protein [Bacillus nakamurai]|uniref:Stress protein n=1 Tax=Bacillus nakamurai TaxID=1793963 RepID=A0A150F7U2_9BACI|nr:universal stress protein [Bacillus nakamurai]KXZ20790.1 stress protein [Bacillus nakamurai]MED1227018.1 universal stress protein [Bacillus nakamurai]